MQKKQDHKYHTLISWLKSIIRIIGYIILLFDLTLGVFILIFAEIIGIVEEKDEV